MHDRYPGWADIIYGLWQPKLFYSFIEDLDE